MSTKISITDPGSPQMVSRFRAYLAWFAATAFVFFQFFLQSAATIMSDRWSEDFQLNEIELGNLSAAFFYSYIPMQLPAGILYDKFQARIILFLSAATLSVSSLIFAYVHNYEVAVIARFFMGLGAASGFVGLLRIIQNHFSTKQFALMFGIAEAIGMLGVSAGLIFLATFLKIFSWRSAMYLCGAISGILAIGIHFFIKDSERKSVDTGFSFGIIFSQMKSILINRQVIFCSIYGFFITSILNCFTSLWGEPFLSKVYNFDPKIISMLLSIVFIGIALGSPLNGWFVKKYGRYKELLLAEAALSTLVVSLIIFLPGISVPGFFFLFFMIGFLCSGYGACYALVNEAVRPEIQATAVATANMLIVASAPILQVLVGWVLESQCFGFAITPLQNYRIALSILPLSYLIAFIAAFFIKSTIGVLNEQK